MIALIVVLTFILLKKRQTDGWAVLDNEIRMGFTWYKKDDLFYIQLVIEIIIETRLTFSSADSRLTLYKLAFNPLILEN